MWVLGLGLVVGGLIAGPTFVIEERWHGSPLIDQHGYWWMLPAGIMALGFFAGGAIVGSGCRRRGAAWVQSALVAGVTVWVIFCGDLVRRHVYGEMLSHGVEKLWFVAGICAVVAGSLGGIVGNHHSDRTGHRPN
jgi:hypothetical protein